METIAIEILHSWKSISPKAIESVAEMFKKRTTKRQKVIIINNFLRNSKTWKGSKAEHIKGLLRELKQTNKSKNCSGQIYQQIMHEYKYGKLHSGKGGPIVKNPIQAKAIANSYVKKLCKN